ncbi:glycosyltransferase [Paracoccus cavernae]|uniref:Glycosyltransferase n=1 Tax=Paracoccus cavernae TaxID=1571207 RepID=A0ABT8DAG6_9RHOB|nr:glycosyltransferase [Paracoccus cavernae]
MLPVEERPASDQRPAVLVGFHWLEVGGAEKLAFDTVNWALEAGLRVIVVASVPALQRLADRLPNHPDVQFIRVDRFLPHHLWPRFLVKLIEQENIRLIHIHHCTPIYAALAHIRATIPQITVIDSTHIVEYNDGGYPRISGVWTNYIDFQHVISNQLKTFFDTRFHHRDKVLLGRMLTRSEEEITLPPVTMEAGKRSSTSPISGGTNIKNAHLSLSIP